MRRSHPLRMIKGIGFCTLFVWGMFVPEGVIAEPKSNPDAILYSGDYPGWPWVCRGSEGKLYCVFREGTVHMFSENGRVMLTESRDGGKTWSPARVIADEPGVDDRNAAIAELPNGDLLVNYNTYTQDARSQAMVIRSSDDGKTWTRPQPIHTVPDSRTRACAKVLSNGWILIPLYLSPGDAAVAAVSKDRGKTWEGIRIPNTEGFVGDEWDLIETEPGHLIGMSRNNHRPTDRFIYKLESFDYGMTWKTPVKTNVQTGTYPAPVQIFLGKGVPTMIFPDERMVSVAALFTKDPAFVNWNLERMLPCYSYREDRTPIPDGGYAVSAPVSEDRRLIVDYEIREDSKRIAGYFVDFPDDWGMDSEKSTRVRPHSPDETGSGE